MKITSWNVNSLRVRLEQVCDWIEVNQPDALALQEIKMTDEMFPMDELASLGYQAVVNGQKTYNGVAIISREPADDIVTEIPGFDDEQRRVLAATVNGYRIIDLYVPNGQSVDSDKYQYKLQWLAAMREFLHEQQSQYPNLVVLGDFNIAPEDRDVHDPNEWKDGVLVSKPERDALTEIMNIGLVDTFRLFDQAERTFSWWDYRGAAFRRNRGLRIDLVLASSTLAERCVSSNVDIEPRTLERPSDHAPVTAVFA